MNVGLVQFCEATKAQQLGYNDLNLAALISRGQLEHGCTSD